MGHVVGDLVLLCSALRIHVCGAYQSVTADTFNVSQHKFCWDTEAPDGAESPVSSPTGSFTQERNGISPWAAAVGWLRSVRSRRWDRALRETGSGAESQAWMDVRWRRCILKNRRLPANLKEPSPRWDSRAHRICPSTAHLSLPRLGLLCSHASLSPVSSLLAGSRQQFVPRLHVPSPGPSGPPWPFLPLAPL